MKKHTVSVAALFAVVLATGCASVTDANLSSAPAAETVAVKADADQSKDDIVFSNHGGAKEDVIVIIPD